MDKFIETLEKKLPELATTNDLIEVGIFESKQTAYKARILGKSPDYLQMPFRGVLYPKQSVIDFVRNSFVKGDMPALVKRRLKRIEHKKFDKAA